MLDETLVIDGVGDLVADSQALAYESVEIIDYSEQMNTLCSASFIIIFMLGVLSGVALGNILWERVTLWK